MPTTHITLDRDAGIATITLNRAARRNALTTGMLRDLERIGCELADDTDTRAVIIRAEGADFSVGADITEAFSAAADATLLRRRRAAELGGQMMRSLQEIPQPTICAINGIATGGAACIASACDFRIAAEEARIGYGEVKIGMNLMWNALPVCVHLVGPARAKQMIMSGKLYSAGVLEGWGFLDEIVPAATLHARAQELAQEYAALPPIPVQMIKRSVNMVSGALDRALTHMDADQWLLTSLSEDFREATAAFLEKRKPKLKGN